MNEFTEDFVEEFFRTVLSKKTFLDTVIPYMKSNYYPLESQRAVWDEIVRQYKREKRLPTFGSLTLALKSDKESLNLLGRVKRTTVVDHEDLTKSLEEFIRQSKFVETYDQLGDVYNEGDKQKAYSMFVEKAKEWNDFNLKTSVFERIFKDYNKRQFDRTFDTKVKTKERIPYGIDELDDITGGYEKGEITLFLGDSGVGKSQLLIHEGITAARNGMRVAHFQAEGTRQQCVDRYDASWTGMLYKDIKRGEQADDKRSGDIKKIVNNIGRGEIFVEVFEQFNSKSVVDIRNSLMSMKKLYGDIDVVVIDYFELIDPGDGRKYSPSEERHRQQAIGRAFKNLAVEFNVAIVTATQASSIAPEMLENPDFVITRFNLSEDKGKIRPFDNFITINQTKDERKKRIVRLYCDKFREHDSGQVVTIVQDLSRCRFYDRKKTKELINED